jgi:hypothetical protein
MHAARRAGRARQSGVESVRQGGDVGQLDAIHRALDRVVPMSMIALASATSVEYSRLPSMSTLTKFPASLAQKMSPMR